MPSRVRSARIAATAVFVVAAAAVAFFVYREIAVPRWNQFTMRSERLSFRYPKNWAKIPREDLRGYNPRAKIGFTKEDSDDSSFVIRIDRRPGGKTFDVQRSIVDLRRLLSSRLLDFRLRYIRESEFKGQPAIEVKYEYAIYTAPNEWSKVRLAQRQVIFLYEQKLYWIMFSARPHEFARDAREFQKILDSLELL